MLVAFAIAALAEPAADGWTVLAPGLDLGSFVAPVASTAGDSTVHVVRVDPAKWRAKLLEAGKERGVTGFEWARNAGAVAVINAGMFEMDGTTSTGFMKTREGVNQSAWKSSYNDVLLLDPLENGVAPFRIADRTCEPYQDLVGRYGTAVQSLRMIGCDGKPSWGATTKKWSAAVIGIDDQGRLLLIHVRSPYTMPALIGILQGLPLGLVDLQYAEGGPEAQLYVHIGDVEHEWVGSWETGFWENDDNRRAWPVPNVVAIVPMTP